MPEVGQAILNYLRQGRPQTSLREFFVKATAPAGAFANGSSLYTIFSRRIRRAGLKPEGKRGPHAIRYARAMSLLRANIPLKSIGDVLGHRSAASTQLYLKLATEDLRSVALAVPGGGCMRKTWPDREQALLRRYVAEPELNQESPRAGKPYESVLRRFRDGAFHQRIA